MSPPSPRLRTARLPSGVRVPGDLQITLTAEQVADILRGLAGVGLPAEMLFAVSQPSRLRPLLLQLTEDPMLSRSTLIALIVLTAFPQDGRNRGVQEIAGELELPASTLSRYLATWLAVGWLIRDPATRRYRLAEPGARPFDQGAGDGGS